MPSLESYYIIFLKYGENQNHHSGNHGKHTGLFFHNTAYSRYNISSKMFWTRFTYICMLIIRAIKRSVRIMTTSYLKMGLK
jgi:hypothetical protein